ncbi:MAG TPA: HIT domain-containing protein [Actinomycetota bacterium]|nr:HIT domain-containing protein [Actinomycetota bacterium]
MERLWTPWRMAYIKGAERHDACIFCDFPAQDAANDGANLIVARGDLSFVILNKFPYNTGHVMVAPYRHTGEWESLSPEELAEITAYSQRTMNALKETLGPQGFNVGVNQGVSAGAGIVDHVHLHVVPRWGGDTNFMTTVGGSKVIPEDLETTFARLKPHL